MPVEPRFDTFDGQGHRRVAALLLPYIFGVIVVALAVLGGLREASTAAFGGMEPQVRDGVPVCHGPRSSAVKGGGVYVDPVCRMQVGTAISAHDGSATHYFCTERCRDVFLTEPSKYLADTCPVCRADGSFEPVVAGIEVSWEDSTYRFCSIEHREAFRRDPAGYFLHSMWGIPSWLYYASIALVLLLSFVVLERGGRRTKEARHRLDLLRLRPLRWILTRPQTRPLLQLGTASLFLLIIGAGLFGNQLPSRNVAPLLTWTVWWGGLILVILYFGKAFCYVCPWDALAGWLESLRFWGARRSGLSLGLRVPRVLKNIWPAIFLFVFLTWVELGLGVTLKPRATAYLALGILGLAVVCALVFERRSFCRYACLVGRISGLYALFSPVEVRSRSEDVCRQCTTHSCYKGNARGNGCPTWQFPGTMANNTYCTMCLECLRTCEPGNMTLQARPWGEDLKRLGRPRPDEAVLALILLALTGFHGLTMTGAWRDLAGAIDGLSGIGRTASFSLGMVLLLVVPLLVYGGLIASARWLSGRDGPRYGELFVRYAYSFLPIAFFYHLAHNAEHLFLEGQKVLTLVSDPFGWQWDLFGTAGTDYPPLMSLSTLWGIQVLLVLLGHVYGLWAAHHVTASMCRDRRAALRSQIPMLVAMVLFSVFSLWLLKQPMEMRSSTM